MGQCSSSCFPFTGPPPMSPSTIIQIPTKSNNEGHTFVVSRDHHSVGSNPWSLTSDVQWKITNAEGEDWLYITTNSDWEHFEQTKGKWAELRRYQPEHWQKRKKRKRTTTTTPPFDINTTNTDSNDEDTTDTVEPLSRNVLSIYLHLQETRGLVHATFKRNDIDIATASWFVTPSAIECMGCQVAVELRDEDEEINKHSPRAMEQTMHGSEGVANGSTRRSLGHLKTTSSSHLDWQLRRVDSMTLVLNHVNQPAAIIQLRVARQTQLSLLDNEEEEEANEVRGNHGKNNSNSSQQNGMENIEEEGEEEEEEENIKATFQFGFNTNTANKEKEKEREKEKAKKKKKKKKEKKKTTKLPSSTTTTVAASVAATRAIKNTFSSPPSTTMTSRPRMVEGKYAISNAFCVHTAENEDPILMLAMGFFFGSGVIRSVRRRWECEDTTKNIG